MSKFIVVKEKTTHKTMERIDCNHLYNNFQIGYEAGKLVEKYPEDIYMIYMEKSR